MCWRRFRIPLLLLVPLLAAAGCEPPWSPASGVEFVDAMEQAVLEAVNGERVRAGLEPLARDRTLARIARDHTADMVLQGRLAHRGGEGDLIENRYDSAGLDWREAGENVARNRGYDDPVAEAVRGWMASPGHRAVILSDRFEETGVGAARAEDSGYVYITQVFLRRMPQ